MTNSDAPPRWDRPGYLDIAHVALLEGFLDVEFADGEHVSIPAGLFGIPSAEAPAGNATVNTHDDGLSVVVTLDGDERIISGLDLRAASDDEFADELRRRDAEAARRIGLRLKALREDRGVNQRDLAALVGMTAPQLSKIESGNQDLRVSTLRTLVRALGASINEISGPNAPEISRDATRRRLTRAGLHSDVAARLSAMANRVRISSVVESVFDWTTDNLLSSGALPPTPMPVAVQFKARDRAAIHDKSPTARLAYAITSAALLATQTGSEAKLPEDPAQIRSLASDLAGRVTLETLLGYLWECGIPVVPANLKGPFAGAAWRVDGRTTITLAESNSTTAFWLFTLGHEVGHLALGHLGAGPIVDIDDPRPTETSDEVEAAANEFALELLLPSHQQMLDQIRTTSGGHYLRFKDAVVEIASEHNVSSGLLGMVAAYELTDIGQNKDRWGSATNLAKAEGDGRTITRNEYRRHMSGTRTSDDDASALVDAFVLDD